MKSSVALCTWNGAQYLREQLQSIFGQTRPVQEIIICDDGSVDGTRDIIKSFEQQYPGIISFMANPTKLEARKNFEQAIRLCTGDLIFLCDQDDVWCRDKVQVTLDFFTDHPDAMGAFSNGSLLHDGETGIERTIWGALSFSTTLQETANAANLFEMLLKLDNFVTGAALCIRKETTAWLFPFYCPPPDYWHDYWIALQIAKRNQLYLLSKKLIGYRVHHAQQTGFSLERQADDMAWLKEAAWNDQFEGMATGKTLSFILNAIRRCNVYANYYKTVGEDNARIDTLRTSLNSQLPGIKTAYFEGLGFIGRKKLWVKAVQKPVKYNYLSFRDRLRLLFS
ncbi:MAG: glycosyltransferase [Chitinophagaceae bacterium]